MLHIVTRQKIAEIIQITPSKVWDPWFLILCEVTWMIHDCSLFCVGCSWVPCLFWTVELSTVLQTNPPRSVDSAVFQHFCIFEPFPAVTVWFWDPSFHTEENWWTQNTTIKKVQHSLMLQKNTWCIKSWLLKTFEQDEDFQLFSFVEQKLFCFLCWSCVWVHQFSSVWKDGSQNHTVTAGKVQICKNAGKLQNLQNVEDLSEEQCSVQLFRTNKGLMNNQHKTKEQSWIIQVTHTVLRTKGSQTFEGGYLIISAIFCLVDYM